MELMGLKSALFAHNKAPHGVSAGANGTFTEAPIFDFFFDRYSDSFAFAIQHLVECIKTDASPLCSLDDGRKALELSEACEASARTGTWVKL